MAHDRATSHADAFTVHSPSSSGVLATATVQHTRTHRRLAHAGPCPILSERQNVCSQRLVHSGESREPELPRPHVRGSRTERLPDDGTDSVFLAVFIGNQNVARSKELSRSKLLVPSAAFSFVISPLGQAVLSISSIVHEQSPWSMRPRLR